MQAHQGRAGSADTLLTSKHYDRTTTTEAAGIDWTDKAKAFLEAEGFKKGKVLSEKTYHGDSRWIAAHDSVMDEHGNWKIGNWDKVKIGSRKEKYNVAKMSDSEFMANETLSKIFQF